jgi:hypothetical protein
MVTGSKEEIFVCNLENFVGNSENLYMHKIFISNSLKFIYDSQQAMEP